MKCEICGKEILRDSQCINYKYYHNDCIENLQEENKKQKEKVRELATKIKFNEKSRRKMQQSLMKQIDDLEQQYKKQKETIDKVINDLNIILEIVREQPSGSDCWIINRLKENKKILKEVSE